MKYHPLLGDNKVPCTVLHDLHQHYEIKIRLKHPPFFADKDELLNNRFFDKFWKKAHAHFCSELEASLLKWNADFKLRNNK